MIKSQTRQTATATVTVDPSLWTEARYDEPPGQPALAQADWKQSYQGDLTGDSAVRMLIVYTAGDPAQPKTLVGDYVGFERFTGILDGRKGSFVIEFRGRHEDATVHTTGRIVPDSGTGSLAGIHGEMEIEASDMTFLVTLHYAFSSDPDVH